MRRFTRRAIYDGECRYPASYRVLGVDRLGVYGKHLPAWIGNVEHVGGGYDDVALLTPADPWYQAARKAAEEAVACSKYREREQNRRDRERMAQTEEGRFWLSILRQENQ